MKDLIKRLQLQRNEGSYRQRRTEGSRSNKPMLDDVALSQWTVFYNSWKYKGTMTLCEEWRKREVFVEWFTKHRDYDLKFCYHINQAKPTLISPDTCKWVHEEVYKLFEWIYATRCRRKKHSYYPIGVRYIGSRNKIESSWNYCAEEFGSFRGEMSLEKAQVPFKEWFLDKLDQCMALAPDDGLVQDVLQRYRTELLRCIREELVFDLEVCCR